MELAESNLGAIHNVVARLIEVGHNWVKEFKPLVEEKAQIEGQINELVNELGERNKLAQFPPQEIDQLMSMGLISEGEAQKAKQLQILRTELTKVEARLRTSKVRIRTHVSRRGRRIKLADLLQEGIIAPGMKFRLRPAGTLAIVTDTGQLDVEGDCFDTPSAAATALLGRSANGWREWTFQDDDGRWKAIDELRQRLSGG